MSTAGNPDRALLAQPPLWPRTEVEQALKLALLVVRAGAKDSLSWWDDEALTQAGGIALARLFPRNSDRIAIRLAFQAAKERHAGVLAAAGVTQSTTLLDLASPMAESIALTPAREPIKSPDEFRSRLLALAPQVKELTMPQPEASGLLDLTSLAGRPGQSLLERTTILAAGYLPGQVGKPVFPFIRLTMAGSP